MPRSTTLIVSLIGVFIVFCVVSPSTNAQERQQSIETELSEFQFRNHRIGEQINVSFPKQTAGNRVQERPHCSRNENEIVLCDDPSIETKGLYGPAKKVGDAGIIYLKYRYFNDMLYGLDMRFGVWSYSKIRQMLIGRYGQPSDERLSFIQGQTGSTFDNTITEWRFKEGVLRLHMRYLRVDYALLEFENFQVEREIQAKRATRDQARGKTAF